MRDNEAHKLKREELSQFLRSRRGKLSPVQVGFSASARRRTPGLRREEVAVLAGVGTSWYTWLEQGRDISISASVAGAIARALRLGSAETVYFYRLTGIDPATLDTTPTPLETSAISLSGVVEGWMPAPAFVIDHLWNFTAMNDAARCVFGFGETDTNLLRSYFANPHCRSRYVDSDELAKVTVAQFRAGAANRFHDEDFRALVHTVSAESEEFRDLWNSHDVSDMEHKVKLIDDPVFGRLTFDVHIFQLVDDGAQRLVLHQPTPLSDTAEKVASLLEQRAAALLHVVPCDGAAAAS
ncbi:helix-turn-helix transcriptional regulator [Rhodococcus sp. G-MC3]|uniref:helix-turn-helix transcriptional regulator n=1 Tax=Rhodococcus sp. G-MC3 TaxID=3046209 RepID=UPI0024BBA6FA|nr:helix-turn-helix transcriptional regulator [Rhodococcus sp. G-MC3]MDJ0396706.1 helix-turn-helix transcriptional regulator [Rhodococcus sp. G-MC3]